MARLGAGLAAFSGALAVPSNASAQNTDGRRAGEAWQPARHPQDDWLEQIPGKHRFFFDATTPAGTGDALSFTSNFLYASAFGYQLAEEENAVVICLRHWATPFAFSDAIWAKYGGVLSEQTKFLDPKTSAAPIVNVFLTKGYGFLLNNRENTFTDAVRRRMHFAVCDMATRRYAGLIAAKLALKTDDVYGELQGSAHANSHFVAAGIVAVNRAQERGYAIQYLG